ncbi:hypothetical protein, variant [Verruconis gallopava]|uniref:C2H2-type domain-containing protein n=1 Tax=Verruconis gallopava TaxID=253628 RepID=A0A0D2A798_9PEZI|nr:hypothetical protein, variant [Verruconis gallopava]KIW02613.1 hypothetical protein, variant [Verruconis gallopava]
MSQTYDDYDAYGLGEREQLVPFKPKITPESSPERSVNITLPSKGDAYLLRISQPNYTDVHREAERHLPSADSDEESGEDVADIDERIAQEMFQTENGARKMNDKKQNQYDQRRIESLVTAEVEMVDVADVRKQATPFEKTHSAERTEAAEDLPQLAANALQNMGIHSPPNYQTTSTDPTDSDRRQSSSTTTSAQSRKLSDGLGIRIKSEAPSSFTPMTPVEPSFQNSDPFFVSSYFPKHRNSVGSPGEKIPAISPVSPEAANSLQKLPSAKEIIEIANKTNEHRQRQASLSSMSAPSPLPNGHYRASFSNAHPSPSMIGEPKSSLVLSPPSVTLRRESYPLASSAAATTGDSLTSPDAASPHTLPTPKSNHRLSIDENTRTLPPLPGLGPPSISVSTIPAAGSGGYKCDFPGCTAPPFQTSYLLNSHANVHSTNRPHYCPVPGCPRGEGGKGFKRKNEMIRHGLVHDSPGYVCPFCPDREHKYPRPDNLQRHVRVHHTDKSKEDPLLKGVLAQRPELGGGSRGRRRRMAP